jgi:hypothetical protein
MPDPTPEPNFRRSSPAGARSAAARILQVLKRVDSRLLIPLCSAAGLAAWLVPRQMLGAFFFPALCLLWLAYQLLPEGKKLLRGYALFSLFWGLSHFALRLWEHPDVFWPAMGEAGIFGVRLFSLLGLALGVPLTGSALTAGRVLTWYLQGLAVLEEMLCALPCLRGRFHPRLRQSAWNCGLALAVMLAFLPRTLRTLRDLRRNLNLRAPHLSSRRRMILLGLGALRLFGAQAWSMTVSIAARDLYRPLPWTWRKEQG